MKFYTNVVSYGDDILLSGYEDGFRVRQEIKYKPYLFIKSKVGRTDYHTLSGKKVDRIDFDSIKEARNFVSQYKEVAGFDIYGNDNYVNQFIHSYYGNNINYDIELIKTLYIDIEVKADDGFPDPLRADKEVTAITIAQGDKIYTFGNHPYTPSNKNVVYKQCQNEKELLHCFIKVWRELDPDIVTGWNIETFDIPYLVNRISFLLGKDMAMALSPWKIVRERRGQVQRIRRAEEDITYEILGINVLDYLALYRKFVMAPRESYKLDHISFIELGERKLDYSEYSSLIDLYKNNFSKFIDYNIKDTLLVQKLQEQLKLIDQALTVAYDSQVNYSVVFTTVQLWDTLITNYLIDKKIIVPPKKYSDKDFSIVGGFVKDPIVGMNKWVVSFDVNSLYPSLIMQYNISPETFKGQIEQDFTIVDYLEKKIDQDTIDILKKENWAITATGCLWDRDRYGHFPQMVKKIFDDRFKYRKLMSEYQAKYKQTKNIEDNKKYIQYKFMQHARKNQLNSLYGAFANKYFRFFDPRFAESITKTGQLTIRWVAKNINDLLNKELKTDNEEFIIASDTDSIYISFDKLVQKHIPNEKDTQKVVDFIDKACNHILIPSMDKAFEELHQYMNSFVNTVKMKRECIADKGVWTGKKHYILNVFDEEGVRYTEPVLKMMGIETVKSSTPPACKDSLKTAFKILMSGTAEDLTNYVNNFRNEFRKLQFEEVSFPRTVNGVDKYADNSKVYKKGTPLHVRGSLIYNNMLENDPKLTKRFERIKEGDKIRYCYLKLPNPSKDNIIAVPNVLPRELGLTEYLDYDKMFDKGFLEPLKSITDVVGWNLEGDTMLDGLFSND